MEQGGYVLWIISLTTLVMWTLVFERIFYFLFEHEGHIQLIKDRWYARSDHVSWFAHQIRNRLVSEFSQKVFGSFFLIQSMFTLCPLLGLLGTVTGMVTVFDAMALHGGNARSMAAGVSMATIPTMAGMFVSLSGLLAATVLKRKMDKEVLLLETSLVV